VSQLDFALCKQPENYSGPRLGCHLIEIDGRVLDALGKPFADAEMSTPGDFSTSDSSGRYVLFADEGAEARILADGADGECAKCTASESVKTPTDDSSVDAHDMTINPHIWLADIKSQKEVSVRIGGLPSSPPAEVDSFFIAHRGAVPSPGPGARPCIGLATGKLRDAGDHGHLAIASVFPPLSQLLCTGPYMAGVTIPGNPQTLAQARFEISDLPPPPIPRQPGHDPARVQRGTSASSAAHSSRRPRSRTSRSGLEARSTLTRNTSSP
jgi:hypothetical protein